MVQVQNTIVQTAKFVHADSELPLSQVANSAIAAIAEQVSSGQTLDLSNVETITAIINATATAMSAVDSTINAEQLMSVAATAAEIMALGNQIIDELLASGADLNEIAMNITRLQAVSVGQIAVDLPELATGQVSIEDFLAANTEDAIKTKMASAVVNDPTVRTPEIDLSQFSGDMEDTTSGNNLAISFSDNSLESTEGSENFDSSTEGSESSQTSESSDDCCGCEELESLLDTSYSEMPANNPPHDMMVGDASANSFMGYEGNDTLFALEGDDVIQGNQNQDILNGNQGNDTIYGGKDNDIIRGGKDNDLIFGDLGNDTVCGDLGNDTVLGMADSDIVLGFDGDDLINGNQGDDTVYGGEGNDWVYGGKDNDLVSGGNGDDTVSGDLGNDTLCGCAGSDYLSGGQGEDVFILASGKDADIIADFVVGEDMLQLCSGLTFNDLSITQGVDDQAGNTLIRVSATGELLATLTGVSVGVISADAII
jgi:Ca2+-binding RTX toxin-like protein